LDDLRSLLLRRVYESAERFSRNRHFHAYDDPSVRRTARIARLLRSLRDDLTTDPPGRIEIDWPQDGGLIALDLYWVRRRRTSYLTSQELALVCEDDAVFRALEPHLPRALAKAG